MANHVWTDVIVKSDSKELHETLYKWYVEPATKNSWGGDSVRATVKPIFGEYDKYPTDEIGSKWILVEDIDEYGDDETYMRFCSAWSFPEGFVEKLVSIVVGIDENAVVDVSADEESDDFLIGGYGDKKGFIWNEDDSPERPWEDDFGDDWEGYDDAINEFYEDVLDIKQFLKKQSEKELKCQ